MRRSNWVKPPALHPEAQQSGKVGLICHSRLRSKWKDDPNIWPTALSFIAHCLSLSLTAHSEDSVAFEPLLNVVKFQTSNQHPDKN